MTNQTILKLFDLLCNEARNTLHLTLGLLEAHCNCGTPGNGDGCNRSNRMSVDRLLRLIDDMRELFVDTPPLAGAAEEFDVSLRVGETIELLNIARGCRESRLVWEQPPHTLIAWQNAEALDQALTPILDLTLKLARHGVARIGLDASPDGGIRLDVTPPNSELAEQLAHWLSADPDQVEFQSGDDVSFGVPLLVAGKRWRGLGGTMALAEDAGAPPHLVLSLPNRIASELPPGQDLAPQEVLNVLVAEDCDQSYALAELLLRKELLTRARTGLEAIDMVKERRFDVIFMDVHMPGMDGYGAIRAIREWETRTANARTPIVLLSSDEIGTQARGAAESGCSGFLRKPVKPREMLDLLDRLRAARAPVF